MKNKGTDPWLGVGSRWLTRAGKCIRRDNTALSDWGMEIPWSLECDSSAPAGGENKPWSYYPAPSQEL